MTNTINIGLLGAGRIGAVHAQTIVQRVPAAKLGAVADVNLTAAQALAARFGIARSGDDPAMIINDPSIDAVLICTSTDTHAPLIEAVARAGKHIFCEKPISMLLGDTDRALAAASAAGVKLQIGFNRRFDANYARVRRAIVEREIGELHMLHIISRDPAPPPIAYVKVSGGIFADMMIHDFDMARFLTGSEPTEIYVQAAVRVDPAIGAAGDVDTAVVLMRFANGTIVTIDNSRKAVYGYDQRVEAFGSAGAIQSGNVYPNTAVLSSADSVRRDLPLNFFMQRYLDAYAAEIESFVDAVAYDKPVAVSGDDGRAAFAMAVAAKKSMESGQPVRIE
ncbi:MAG: inositol 2-dehydrogenase [Chloroflexi bacterium]|nr:inositol 2-dehydrogenase [Chloroflexota bacterium]